jgi:hypothetical protein
VATAIDCPSELHWRLARAEQHRPCAVASCGLEPGAQHGVALQVEHQRASRRRAGPCEQHAGTHDRDDPERLPELHGREPHARQVLGKSRGDVLAAVADPTLRGPAEAAARAETADAPAGEERAETRRDAVQVRQHRPAGQPQRRRAAAEDGPFVVVVDEALRSGQHLRGQCQRQEHDDGQPAEAERDRYGAPIGRGQRAGKRDGGDQAGHAADVEPPQPVPGHGYEGWRWEGHRRRRTRR